MPELDGIKATKLINKELGIDHVPKVIMVSSFKQESIVESAKRSRHRYILAKTYQSVYFK